MRTIRLLLASMFALLAWNDSFAQTEDEYQAAVEDADTQCNMSVESVKTIRRID